VAAKKSPRSCGRPQEGEQDRHADSGGNQGEGTDNGNPKESESQLSRKPGTLPGDEAEEGAAAMQTRIEEETPFLYQKNPSKVIGRKQWPNREGLQGAGWGKKGGKGYAEEGQPGSDHVGRGPRGDEGTWGSGTRVREGTGI